MTAIIFGAGGQDGYYLSQLLSSEGLDLIQVSRSENYTHVNIANWKEVSELVRVNKPDYIFHFAAESTTSHFAWHENHHTISTGVLYLLEAVRQYSNHTKLFLSGSGLQFKNEGVPIKEDHPFEASSIYAVNRINTVYTARYFRKLGVKAYVGYFFNHDSPLRSERHVSKKIAEAAKRIAKGSDEKLSIGDVTVKKEWGFAGDIVKGVWTLIKQDDIFESIIGTGEAYSINEWIQECFNHFKLNPELFVLKEENFQPEYEILVSDPATIFSLGWRPLVSFKELAQMMLRS